MVHTYGAAELGVLAAEDDPARTVCYRLLLWLAASMMLRMLLVCIITIASKHMAFFQTRQTVFLF